MAKQDYKILLFYKFFAVRNPEKLKDDLKQLCQDHNLTGRIIVGREGINGTLEGLVKDVNKFKRAFKKIKRFSDMPFKESQGIGYAFTKLSVRVRDEIVALEAGKFNVKKQTAPNLTAAQLERMYKKDEDFVILDLRNDYEIKAGAFKKTYDPGLENFKDLPKKIKELKKFKDKKVVAVCTGGIRCEKATCLLKEKGFKNIYQLKDGIHTYMQKYPGKNFLGTLFVFDNRMVTDVVPIKNKKVIGCCQYCDKKTEQYYSDDSARPSKKIICCDKCYGKRKDKLRLAVELKGAVKV
jgi:UPF0176 protein